ncbi:MAG: hypothetical protein J1E36_02955 [Eubacterium sp.]|nr:hypothetical protein [Eubacterium sp.]
MDDFKKGFQFVSENVAAITGEIHTNQWINDFDSKKLNMIEEFINSTINSDLPLDKQQGFNFETWHKATYNLNSILNNHGASATTPKVNTLGSADVITNEQGYQLKSYATAGKAYRAVSETPYERYMRLKANAEKNGKSFISKEEYYKKNGIDIKNEHMSLYNGQGKIITKDQLDKAIDLLNKRIEKANAVQNYEQAARYQEVLNTLSDKIINGKDSSVSISHDDIIKITKMAKNGNEEELIKFCEDELGISFSEMVTNSQIAKQAINAGLNAAVISLVLSIAPVILNGISMLINEGEIDSKQFAELGYNSLSGSAKGFINGSITSALVSCCKAEKFGAELANVDPSLISALVVISIGTIEASIKCISGKIDKTEMVEEICRLYIVTGFSTGTGMLLSSIALAIPLLEPLSAFAYMLGSFIGGLIGNFVFDSGKKILMSLCVESGFTFFGLVEQDYTLSDEILKELGMDIFEYDEFIVEQLHIDEFTFDEFNFATFEYDKFEISPLKRGLVEVHKVAYA